MFSTMQTNHRSWICGCLLLSLTSVVLGGLFRCDNLNSTLWVSKKLPDGLALPSNYSVVVRSTDWLANVTSLIREVHNEQRIFINKLSRDGVINVVFGERNFTFNGTACDSFNDTKMVPRVYPLGKDLENTLDFNGFALQELLHNIMGYNFSSFGLENTTKIVAGIDGVVWIGCQHSNTSMLQVEIAYAGENSLPSYSRTVKSPYILSIEIAVLDIDRKVLNNVSMIVTELEHLSAKVDQAINPPPGIICNGYPTVSIPSVFPSKFGMSFDYTDAQGKTVRNIDLLYDGMERVTSMHLNGVNDKNLPFFGNSSMTKDIDNLIHDFNYGFQYLLDSENNVCINVAAIDPNFGDIIISNSSTQEIDLKTPSQLLFNAQNATFYYGGQRTVDDIPLDIYATKSISPTGVVVVEMLFTKEPWIFDSATAPFLHSIIQYHTSNSTNQTSKTTIRVHSFMNNSANGTQWSLFSVYPCLNLVEKSYLYVTVKNVTLKELEILGINRVRDAMREMIAHSANISVLRVGNFFFKQVQENVIAFFVIGDGTGVTPANTRNRSVEYTIEEAINYLNKSLGNDDIGFDVSGRAKKTKLMISKLSLGVIPAKFGPISPSNFTGYSGGSMFVLGFFMLLLGAFCSFGVFYLVWKRQHGTGLAYQIFE